MCVYKNHAFIYFLRPPLWSGTCTLTTAVLLWSKMFYLCSQSSCSAHSCSPLTVLLWPQMFYSTQAVLLCLLRLFYPAHSCSTLPTVVLHSPQLFYFAHSRSTLPIVVVLSLQLFYSTHSRSTLPKAVLLYSSCSTVSTPTAPLCQCHTAPTPPVPWSPCLKAPLRLCSAIRRGVLDQGNTPTLSLLPTSPRYLCFPTPYAYAKLYFSACRYIAFLETVLMFCITQQNFAHLLMAKHPKFISDRWHFRVIRFSQN